MSTPGGARTCSLHDVVDLCYGPEAGGFYEESDFTPEQIADGTAWRSYASDFKLFPCVNLPEEAVTA